MLIDNLGLEIRSAVKRIENYDKEFAEEFHKIRNNEKYKQEADRRKDVWSFDGRLEKEDQGVI